MEDIRHWPTECGQLLSLRSQVIIRLRETTGHIWTETPPSHRRRPPAVMSSRSPSGILITMLQRIDHPPPKRVGTTQSRGVTERAPEPPPLNQSQNVSLTLR